MQISDLKELINLISDYIRLVENQKESSLLLYHNISYIKFYDKFNEKRVFTNYDKEIIKNTIREVCEKSKAEVNNSENKIREAIQNIIEDENQDKFLKFMNQDLNENINSIGESCLASHVVESATPLSSSHESDPNSECPILISDCDEEYGIKFVLDGTLKIKSTECQNMIADINKILDISDAEIIIKETILNYNVREQFGFLTTPNYGILLVNEEDARKIVSIFLEYKVCESVSYLHKKFIESWLNYKFK
jgi:hypothetical protein